LVAEPLGPLLKYHKALAVGVECVLAIERIAELEPMLKVLSGICPVIHRLRPAEHARDRTAAERKAYREQRYREHFRDAGLLQISFDHLIDFTGRGTVGRQSLPGTVVGLLDEKGFCLGLGLVEEVNSDRLAIYTACRRPEAVVRVQLAKVRLDRRAGFSELQ